LLDQHVEIVNVHRPRDSQPHMEVSAFPVPGKNPHVVAELAGGLGALIGPPPVVENEEKLCVAARDDVQTTAGRDGQFSRMTPDEVNPDRPEQR